VTGEFTDDLIRHVMTMPEIIEVQAIAPRYRAVPWDGDWGRLMTAMPKLRFPYSHPIFPDEGYLLLDHRSDVVCGWCSSLEGFSVLK